MSQDDKLLEQILALVETAKPEAHCTPCRESQAVLHDAANDPLGWSCRNILPPASVGKLAANDPDWPSDVSWFARMTKRARNLLARALFFAKLVSLVFSLPSRLIPANPGSSRFSFPFLHCDNLATTPQ